MKLRVAALSFFLPVTVAAEPLNLEYATFYSHLRKIDDEALNQLQFAFGFKHVGESRLCKINQARIHTQKVDLPIEISTSQRFSLPTEKALKLARAEVQLDLADPVNQCDMSVKIETKTAQRKSQLAKEEVATLLQQFDEFYSDMGSFLSFLMPKPDGLLFEFNQEERVSVTGINRRDIKWHNNQLLISREAINQLAGELTFSQRPLSITAHINQD